MNWRGVCVCVCVGGGGGRGAYPIGTPSQCSWMHLIIRYNNIYMV